MKASTILLSTKFLFSLLPMLVVISDAFSAASFPIPHSSGRSTTSPTDDITASTSTSSSSIQKTATATTTYAPWRIVLDIGREPLASAGMPFDWARSGCRMPIVIPCDLGSDRSVIPQSETVSFTGPNGAVVKPVQGGKWTMSDHNKDNNDGQPSQLSLTLTLPQKLERRDVWIEAGSTLTLETNVFTKQALDRLNQEYYEAREEAWNLGGELNDMVRIQQGPKKWNDELKQWEQPQQLNMSSMFSGVQKRVQLFSAQAKKNKAANQRPDPNTISELGSFTNDSNDSNCCLSKQGIIKVGSSVIGKWSAEPMLL